MKNLTVKELMKHLTAKELRDELTRLGYYTGNLWHIDDVQGRFDATNDQAMDVLDKVLSSEWLTGAVFECIDDLCSDTYESVSYD